VEVVLQQFKVVKRGDAEVLESADRIKPGEIFEYQAVYSNVSSHTVRQLQATLPIPPDTEYVPASARPQAVLASVDGTTFAALPLRRKVALPNGKIEERDVPVEEYRSLRWPIGNLDAGRKVTVAARIRLAPIDRAPTGEAKKQP
jgi:uncharacterized repeat protein (TIGR01451 family)